MSTKTSIKRIALVAVSALGFGLLSVVPAKAADAETGEITVGALTTTNPSGRTGVAYTATSAITIASTASTAETATLVAAVVSAPAGSTASPTIVNAAGTGATVTSNVISITAGGTAAAATSTLTFTPDVAGSYTLILFNDNNGDGMLTAGEASATKNISVVSGSDPVTATITQYNTRAAVDATGNGALVRVALTNSAGAAASLGAFESITASVSTGVVYKVNNSTSNANAASAVLVRGSFNASGRAYLNLASGSAASQVLTITGTNGAALAGISLSATTTFATAAGTIASALTVGNTTGVAVTTAHVYNATPGSATAGAWYVNPLKTTTVSIASTATAGAVVPYTVTQGTTGDLFGSTTQYAFTSYVTATSAGVVTISAPAFTPLAASNAFVVGVGPTVGNNTITITATAGTPSAAGDVTRDQAATLRVAPGGSVTVSAVWKDKFGVAAPNQTVSVSVANRNAQVVTQNSVTDASGRVSFTYTDAPLAGVTATSDTVTFDGPSSADVTFTINWAAVTVGAVAINTPDTTAGVANTVKAAPSPINAGSSGASGTVVSISADVTDANGAVYAGIPVTFTIEGTGAAILSTKVTTYTDSTGNATSSVYGWKTGTYTVTATAGGKSSTGSISFASTTASNARIVTATVDGNVVTGKVVDRYGNPVSGVTLYATTTKPANIGGIFVSGVATGTDGTSSWVVTGSGVVTVSAVNPSDPAGTTFGQTCAAATKVSCAATATALLAATAGTSTTAETNVGNDQAPEGVASASVTVAAVDAAADAATAASDAALEAIDAANAATDAANLAAEAADAATVAAEEARDAADAATAAVEALASEMATLFAALKAQLTTLAKTVAKIAKKVKA